MKNLFDIKDYVVVITGGTGVLGCEIGKYLALQGAHVVLLGRKEEVGKRLFPIFSSRAVTLCSCNAML